MHTDQYGDFPNLALLAGEYWITDPNFHSLPDDASTHEIESLKLYAYIVWPTVNMYDKRRTFLAQCALRLRDKNRDIAADVQHGRDGVRRSPDFAAEIARIYTHASDLGVTHLLNPSGGLVAALQSGQAKIATDIDRQLGQAKTAVCVADFILRYLVHIKNAWETASVNKAVAFIEDGGYEKQGFRLPRHRSEIRKAWSQAKPSIIFSLAAFYSETIFLSNILETPDPAETLDAVWRNNLSRERFFGIAQYCEKELSSFVPKRREVPLLDSTRGMSVSNLEGMAECCPILRGFSDQDLEKISTYSVTGAKGRAVKLARCTV
jgi:hypothetical protein